MDTLHAHRASIGCSGHIKATDQLSQYIIAGPLVHHKAHGPRFNAAIIFIIQVHQRLYSPV